MPTAPEPMRGSSFLSTLSLSSSREAAMLVRATRFFPPVIAALVACGCGSEGPYNIPADASKEAAAIGAGTPQRKVAAGRKKPTKPPGAQLKDASNLGPRD